MEEWIDDLRSGRGRSFANSRRLPPRLFEELSRLFISATTMNTHTENRGQPGEQQSSSED